MRNTRSVIAPLVCLLMVACKSEPVEVQKPIASYDNLPLTELSSHLLKADGPDQGDDAYTLIRNFAGVNAIEAPDLYAINHPAVQHISESSDAIVGHYFNFTIHRDNDIDRDKQSVTDRQRNEIKIYDGSDEALKGYQDKTFIYSWKFKVSTDMAFSTKFTHLFQLKAVGGDDLYPILTLTAAERSGTDSIEVRYSPSNTLEVLSIQDVSLIAGEWIEVYCRVTYAESGSLRFIARKVSDGSLVFNLDETDIDLWRGESADHFVRPKWGIYRSIEDYDNLRSDEEVVSFADFVIAQVELE